MSYTFGFSCDEVVYRLIQRIPRGERSGMIRDAILAFETNIEALETVFQQLEEERIKLLRFKLEIERQNRIIREQLQSERTTFDVNNWTQNYIWSEIETIP